MFKAHKAKKKETIQKDGFRPLYAVIFCNLSQSQKNVLDVNVRYIHRRLIQSFGDQKQTVSDSVRNLGENSPNGIAATTHVYKPIRIWNKMTKNTLADAGILSTHKHNYVDTTLVCTVYISPKHHFLIK